MQSIIDLKLLERLRVGPLAQYFDPYLARIAEEGFLPLSVPCQAYAITRFSKWLEQKRIPLRDVDGTIVRTFLNRDAGIVHYPERATIHRLVAILRDIGVLKAAHGSKQRVMTLDAVNFLCRFFLHVLPKGFVRIRRYGLLSYRFRKQLLPLARTLLAEQGPEPLPLPPLPGCAPWHCPRCGKAMRVAQRFTAAELYFAGFDSS